MALFAIFCFKRNAMYCLATPWPHHLGHGSHLKSEGEIVAEIAVWQ